MSNDKAISDHYLHGTTALLLKADIGLVLV